MHQAYAKFATASCQVGGPLRVGAMGRRGIALGGVDRGVGGGIDDRHRRLRGQAVRYCRRIANIQLLSRQRHTFYLRAHGVKQLHAQLPASAQHQYFPLQLHS
jgi:hypothetical protein